MSTEDRERLERRAKELFDESVASLDGRTRSKLAQARYRALERAEQGRASPFLSPRAIMPAGVAAAAALAVWMLWQQPGPDSGEVEVAALQDLEILLGEEELEMLEELEFYTWLEELPEFSVPEGDDDSVG